MYYFLEDFSRIGIMCKYIDITMVRRIEQKSPRPKKTVFQGNSIEFENSQKILKVLFSKEVRE